MMLFLLSGQIDVFKVTHREYEGYNGWYNNKANPSLGCTGKYTYVVVV